MPKVTLSIPTEKLPVFRNLIQSLGLEGSIKNSNVFKRKYKSNSTYFANSYFKNDFSWEYYCNELEYE